MPGCLHFTHQRLSSSILQAFRRLAALLSPCRFLACCHARSSWRMLSPARALAADAGPAPPPPRALSPVIIPERPRLLRPQAAGAAGPGPPPWPHPDAAGGLPGSGPPPEAFWEPRGRAAPHSDPLPAVRCASAVSQNSRGASHSACLSFHSSHASALCMSRSLAGARRACQALCCWWCSALSAGGGGARSAAAQLGDACMLWAVPSWAWVIRSTMSARHPARLLPGSPGAGKAAQSRACSAPFRERATALMF